MSEDILEIRYEYGENFVEVNPNTNVIVAAFTTAHARLQLYDELDMLKERVLQTPIVPHERSIFSSYLIHLILTYQEKMFVSEQGVLELKTIMINIFIKLPGITELQNGWTISN